MKKITTLIAILFCAVTLFAQAPEKFTYQAVVRNASNALVANAQVGVRINILQGSTTGDAVYSESHVTSSNANGLITVNIGGGSVIHGSFSSIDWADGPYFLKTDIDPNGGNNYSITSTQQLLSVPYALYAKDAGNVFSGDYNDLTNTPTIPTVPTNVSAFNNDAGYITMDSVPTVPTNVSAFNNDAGYLTGYTETDPQYNAWDKDYNDLINKPTIPTVPTNVSAFTNDAGYITMDSVPTVPTNVSAFVNDAGYLTDYTETDPQYNAWDKDYNDLINKPVIPTVPTNISAFNNDAGYITMDSVPTVPTNVSAFVNDAGYLTNFTEQQVLSISNDTIFLTGGSFVKLPAGFDGDYNSLTNKPEIPTVPTNVSAFTNDAGYLTNETQSLSDVTAIGNSAGNRQLKEVSDPTDLYDAVNLHTLTVAIDSILTQLHQLQQQIDSLNNLINPVNPVNPGVDSFVCGTSQITDIDGNTYNTVKIGQQCWMKENLRTTHFSDGTIIPISNSSMSFTEPYYYDNTSSDIPLESRGYLYNWPAAIHGAASSHANPSGVQGICPTGWHLPSDSEWIQLTDYMKTVSDYVCGENSNNIAKALASTIGWNTHTDECAIGNDLNANNASGFEAVPAGSWGEIAGGGYGFGGSGTVAAFWSSSLEDNGYAWYRSLLYSSKTAYRNSYFRTRGHSVRCLRNINDTINNTDSTQVSLPSVITDSITSITNVSAIGGGNVISNGGDSISARGVCWSTSNTPSINDSHTTDGTGLGAFTSSITNLSPGTVYYVRAYATNSAGTAYGEEISFTTLNLPSGDAQPCPGAPTVTDHEGNVYNTVKIGNQCWMKDNLRTTTSPSTGTYLIPEAGTTHTYSGKQARWYNNDSATYANQNYGLLYNWNAAVDTFNTSYDETSVITSPNYAANALFSGNRRGICPEGWHVPSDAEWTELVTYVSSQPAYISEYDTYHDSTWVAKALALDTLWSTNISTCAVGNDVPSNNLSQFSAVPAGIFQKTNYSSGSSVSEFKYSKNHACFWSSTQNGTNAKSRYMLYDAPDVKSNYSDYGAGKGMGMSVRCLKD